MLQGTYYLKHLFIQGCVNDVLHTIVLFIRCTIYM